MNVFLHNRTKPREFQGRGSKGQGHEFFAGFSVCILQRLPADST